MHGPVAPVTLRESWHSDNERRAATKLRIIGEHQDAHVRLFRARHINGHADGVLDTATEDSGRPDRFTRAVTGS